MDNYQVFYLIFDQKIVKIRGLKSFYFMIDTPWAGGLFF